MKKVIAIVGANGMIGTYLKGFFQDLGYRVYPISKETINDPEELKNLLFLSDIVINLAGENIGSGRWTFFKKKRIYESRVATTKKLVSVLNHFDFSSKLLISASATGYYGSDCGLINGENSPSGEDFLARVCSDWEKAANEYTNGRVVISRFGVVLSKKGGFLKQMERLANLHLLSKFADGKSKTAFIAMDDLARLMLFLIENIDISGAVNFIAPNSFTNEEFVVSLCKKLGKKPFLAIPKGLIKLIFGEKGTVLLLSNQEFHYNKVSSLNFNFKFDNLESYLSYIYD